MKPFAFCPLLFALCLIFCALPTHYNLGREALDKEVIDERKITLLRTALNGNPAFGLVLHLNRRILSLRRPSLILSGQFNRRILLPTPLQFIVESRREHGFQRS